MFNSRQQGALPEFIEDVFQDFVVIHCINNSAEPSYAVSSHTQVEPKFEAFVNSDTRSIKSNSGATFQCWSVDKSSTDIQKLTPGFESEGGNCFANAALKQLILGSAGYEVSPTKVPVFAGKLAQSYKKLNELFCSFRVGKCDQREIDRARTAFF
ncbi:hypothetical protein JQC92_11255 [Shewanella sp. 202IG2-18]|uniref:hypothetical protein n=1 Tax=Parashewanella hymeniacidonis TaxID=2807618 RepID=UPI0019612599|nr:hypothetical protein [Parashewanella hymeniacidonis]MBM7072597.1 hypothetical protein [Parashewanella hymeniacidonis]